MTTIPLTVTSKRKRRSLEAAGWIISLVVAAGLGLILYSLGSRTFTTTIDSPLALPKELAVTSNDANVPLPALGATTSSTVPGTTQSAAEAAGIATPSSSTPTTAAPSNKATTSTPTTAAATTRSTTATTAAPAATRSTTPTTAAPAPVLRNTTATTSAPRTTAPPVTAAPTTTPTTTRSLPTPTLPPPVVQAVTDVLGGN